MWEGREEGEGGEGEKERGKGGTEGEKEKYIGEVEEQEDGYKFSNEGIIYIGIQ